MIQDNLCEKITIYHLHYVRVLFCSDFKGDSKTICFYIL